MTAMARMLVIALSEKEALDLWHILLDQDEAQALAFLNEHARKPVKMYLEGGCKSILELSVGQVPGAK